MNETELYCERNNCTNQTSILLDAANQSYAVQFSYSRYHMMLTLFSLGLFYLNMPILSRLRNSWINAAVITYTTSFVIIRISMVSMSYPTIDWNPYMSARVSWLNPVLSFTQNAAFVFMVLSRINGVYVFKILFTRKMSIIIASFYAVIGAVGQSLWYAEIFAKDPDYATYLGELSTYISVYTSDCLLCIVDVIIMVIMVKILLRGPKHKIYNLRKARILVAELIVRNTVPIIVVATIVYGNNESDQVLLASTSAYDFLVIIWPYLIITDSYRLLRLQSETKESILAILSKPDGVTLDSNIKSEEFHANPGSKDRTIV